MTCWACGGDRWLEGNFGDSSPCPYCKDITMNEVEKFFTDLFSGFKDAVTPKTTTVNDMVGKQEIEVELPEPPVVGLYPNGNDYEEAKADWQAKCNSLICASIPRGYSLKSSEKKEVVRHYAKIVVEKS